MITFVSVTFASQIKKITLSELRSKADLIAMAQVIKMVKKENQDYITIQVDSYLKGSGLNNIYTFILLSSGGLKDFDPSLKKGDTGIFFLKRKGTDGAVEKAYWGGIATFSKNHFYVTEDNTQLDTNNTVTYLNAWRSHRVQRGEIQNIQEYERGFQKGFTGPPGLVDGSADFNLGHSDGMLSKIKRLPNQQN